MSTSPTRRVRAAIAALVTTAACTVGLVATVGGDQLQPAPAGQTSQELTGTWVDPQGRTWPGVCTIGVDELVTAFGYTPQDAVDARESCHVDVHPDL